MNNTKRFVNAHLVSNFKSVDLQNHSIVPYVPNPFLERDTYLNELCLNPELAFNNYYFRNQNIHLFIKYQTEILKKLFWIKDTLQAINTEKGFVSNTEIFEEKHYPIIAQINKFLLTKDINPQSMTDSEKVEFYKWSANILLLNYYTVSNKSLYYINKNIKENLNLESKNNLLDLKTKFNTLRNWAEQLIEPSIRTHFKRNRPKIYADTFTGFDTEYLPEDWGKNILASTQLAINGTIKMEIPLQRKYIFEGVNTLTGEKYSLSKLPKALDGLKLYNYIQKYINYNRLILFENHDDIMEQFTNYLIKDKSDYIENFNATKKGIIFQFKKLPIIQKFITPTAGELLEINWNTLIKIINDSTYNSNYNNLNLYINNILKDFHLKDIYKVIRQDNVEPLLLNTNLKKESESWNVQNLPLQDIEHILLSNKENQKLAESKDFKLKKTFSKTLEEGYKLTIPIHNRTFLAAHYNSADLSLIKDWDIVKKKNVDIIGKSFISINKPMKTLGCRIFLRDTICLTSAAAKTLEAIGKAHNINKIQLEKKYKENMSNLWKDNPDLFKFYAMNDSVITLIHTLFINDFTFKLGSTTLPFTLGSIASKYIKNKWKDDNYEGYQINQNYPLGNIQKSINPEGLQALGSCANHIPMFIGNTMALDSFRGGRNESFTYGIDKNNTWYDYDFTSCYSTVMSMCGHPDYNKAEYITENTNIDETFLDNLLKSYTTLDVVFNFPNSINKPPLPVSVTKNLTIYPLEGRTIVTGLEYFNAYNLLEKERRNNPDAFKNGAKYYIFIKNGISIPFKTTTTINEDKTEATVFTYQPFKSVISELQALRKQFPKKSAMERMYKDLANMLYGKTATGISNKRKFDARTETMKTMVGSDLTNPIIASWITGFVRSMLAEILYQVDKFKGRVTSCTTDGFVSNIENLEEQLIENIQDLPLLKMYRDIRTELSGTPDALEVKTIVKGIIQYKTRGQISFKNEPENPTICAMTGFQSRETESHEKLFKLTENTLANGNKLIYLQKSLTGALDNYKENKHVSMKSRLTNFSTAFDCKREAVIPENYEPKIHTMLDTMPFKDKDSCRLHRSLINKLKTKKYNRFLDKRIIPTSTNILQESIKYFIRWFVYNSTSPLNTLQKLNIIQIINSFFKKHISKEKLLYIFADSEINKGLPVNKMLRLFKNVVFFDHVKSKLKNHPFFERYLVDFKHLLFNDEQPWEPNIERISNTLKFRNKFYSNSPIKLKDNRTFLFDLSTGPDKHINKAISPCLDFLKPPISDFVFKNYKYYTDKGQLFLNSIITGQQYIYNKKPMGNSGMKLYNLFTSDSTSDFIYNISKISNSSNMSNPPQIFVPRTNTPDIYPDSNNSSTSNSFDSNKPWKLVNGKPTNISLSSGLNIDDGLDI